jgi:hypothetical protein
MKNRYISVGLQLLFLATGNALLAQDQFAADFEPVHKELVSWDPVRGEWLSGSLVAMSKHEPIPDRYFPEDLTPGEMLRTLPEGTKINVITATEQAYSRNQQSQQWKRIRSTVGRAECSPVSGRSYGDPHLSSFDGVSNSFQTVGEFVLVESASGNMTVHVRQKNTSDEVSVTNAIAMNVGGDRVAVYGAETPDGNRSTPLRVNGEAIYLDRDTYLLPNGGTIESGGRRSGDYTITWPTGETVKIAGTSQMNIVVQVYPCQDSYQGILGNANGNRSDDYNTRGVRSVFGNGPVDFGDSQVSDQMQREYLAYMSKDFAMSWRISQQESLFDYGFNQNTMTYTDYSYPRVHRTVNDMAMSDRERARRECERAGISTRDMNACIYDVGFARIPPSPAPVVPDRTVGRVYDPVTARVPNTNTGSPTVRKPVVTREAADSKVSVPVAAPVAQPITGQEGGKTTREKAPEASTAEPVKPVVRPAEEKQPELKPATNPSTVTRPVSTKEEKPYEPPVEPEKPKRTVGSILNPGSSSPPSSSPSTSPSRSSDPKPVSKPEPAIKTPAPSKPSAPSPVNTPSKPTAVTRPGRG